MVQITKKAQKKTEPQKRRLTDGVKKVKDNIKLDRHDKMLKTLLEKYGYDYVNNTGMPTDEVSKIEIKKIIQRSKGRMGLVEFKNKIDKYFEDAKHKTTNVIAGATGKVTEISDRSAMSIHGLCNSLGITVNVFKNYMNKEGYEDYHNVAQLAHQRITASLIEGSLEGKFNGTFSKWYLKNTTELNDEAKELTNKIEHINFITVKDRHDIAQLKEENIIDVEVFEDEQG